METKSKKKKIHISKSAYAVRVKLNMHISTELDKMNDFYTMECPQDKIFQWQKKSKLGFEKGNTAKEPESYCKI